MLRMKGTLWNIGRGRKAHLSERGDMTLCGRTLGYNANQWSPVSDLSATWDQLREDGDACKECIRWEYHLYRIPGSRNPMLNVNASR